MSGEQEQLQQLGKQIADLIRRIEGISDPEVKANATALVQSLLDIHARAFERVMEIVKQQDGAGRGIVSQFAADALIGSLLLLYRLHPDAFEVRLNRAIAGVRKAAALQGADVEMIGVEKDMVRLRLSGAAHGCGAGNLQTAIEDAIYEAVPEIAGVQVENAMRANSADTLVQLQVKPGAPTQLAR